VWFNPNDGELGKEDASARQIWFVSYTSGDAHRVTNDANSYVGISLTADGRTLATTGFDYRSGIWVAPSGDFGGAKRISSGKFDGVGGLTWTPAHKLIYSSSVGGKMNLFMVNDDGGQPRQLTNSTGEKLFPSVTPDGRYVLFVNTLAGKTYVWRIDIDGSDPKQLTNTGNEVSPRCSPDSQWVFYIDNSNYRSWKVSVNGGMPVPIESDKTVLDAEVSPDGKLIALNVFDEKFSHSQLQVVPLGTTSPDKIFDIAASMFHWSPDGHALTYILTSTGGEPPTKLWSQPLSGGAPKWFINVEPDLFWSFNWSSDGRLAYARGSLTRDVVLISDFR
jgi:Tol biopolymer transport system component